METSDIRNIELINRIITEAIDHGGDPGGPYFSNPENLRSVINDFLTINKLQDRYFVNEDCYGYFSIEFMKNAVTN